MKYTLLGLKEVGSCNWLQKFKVFKGYHLFHREKKIIQAAIITIQLVYYITTNLSLLTTAHSCIIIMAIVMLANILMTTIKQVCFISSTA